MATAARFLAIKTPLDDGDLLIYRMRVREELGRMSEFQIDLLSPKSDIDFDKIVGQDVTVKLTLPDDSLRYFHGFVTRFVQVGTHGRFFRYHAVVHPWLWFLTRTANCRIFQGKKVPDILKEVLGQHFAADVKFELTGHYRTWDYCVQYRETDFNFVSRLMEQEGIYYYFKHAEGRATMVLADSYSAHEALKGYEQIPFVRAERLMRTDAERITDWQLAREIQPGAYVIKDFDFTKPSTDLKVSYKIKRKHERATYEVYDFPGEYLQTADGEHYVQTRLEELQSEFELAHGESNARGISVGFLFKLTGQPRQDQNAEYLVVKTDIDLEAGEYESLITGGSVPSYACNFTVIKSSEAYRPARITPKPIVQGPQTAIVVGPSGDEINTDKYGRVQVQFPWDRFGSGSFWIRVSQVWAGKNWGMIAIPRMGQEVIVDFLDGDPDEPIITGRVYNAEQMPPYDLPGNKTQTGIKSRSSLKGTGANFNEFRFEDKKGSEQVYLHAEKNQDIEVENDETHTVGHDRTKTIDNDETTTVKHDRTETVGNNETITIGVNRTEKVGSNENITIGANRTESVGANENITIGANRTETVGGNEKIMIHGNRDIHVSKNEQAFVALDRKHAVGQSENIGVSDNQSISVGKNQSVTVGADQSTKVGKNQSVTIAVKASMDIGAAESRNIGGKRSTNIGGADSLDVTEEISITSGKAITLKTGDASISLKKDGTIEIKGKDITIQGSGKIGVKANSDITMKGSKIHQN
jgi:type VI secretion system secreted protein VgrG